jgi:hypothetical protein
MQILGNRLQKKRSLSTKVNMGGSDPVTYPEQVITLVWDDNEIIAGHRTNPNVYRWSQMLVFASSYASKGYKENEVKETPIEWLNQ